MTIINSIYKGKRYAILLTTILTFYAPVLFAQHIADSALVQAWEIVCKDSFPD